MTIKSFSLKQDQKNSTNLHLRLHFFDVQKALKNQKTRNSINRKMTKGYTVTARKKLQNTFSETQRKSRWYLPHTGSAMAGQFGASRRGSGRGETEASVISEHTGGYHHGEATRVTPVNL